MGPTAKIIPQPPREVSFSAVSSGAWPILKMTFDAWLADFAPSMGAALSYYAFFSLAPLLVVVITFASLLFSREVVMGEVFTQLSQLLGAEGALAIRRLIDTAVGANSNLGATIIGVVLLLFAATTVFAELQDDLDRIWKVKRTGPVNPWTLLRDRLLSFGLILGVGFLLVVSLLLSAALSSFGKWWESSFGEWHLLLRVLNSLLGFTLVTLLFAMTYKILPHIRIAWRDVWMGAVATSALIAIGRYLIGLYIGNNGLIRAYGAAGSLVVLLLWVYYSAQIFLLGAEFTFVYSHQCGSRRGKPDSTAPVTSVPVSAVQ